MYVIWSSRLNWRKPCRKNCFKASAAISGSSNHFIKTRHQWPEDNYWTNFLFTLTRLSEDERTYESWKQMRDVRIPRWGNSIFVAVDDAKELHWDHVTQGRSGAAQVCWRGLPRRFRSPVPATLTGSSHCWAPARTCQLGSVSPPVPPAALYTSTMSPPAVRLSRTP